MENVKKCKLDNTLQVITDLVHAHASAKINNRCYKNGANANGVLKLNTQIVTNARHHKKHINGGNVATNDVFYTHANKLSNKYNVIIIDNLLYKVCDIKKVINERAGLLELVKNDGYHLIINNIKYKIISTSLKSRHVATFKDIKNLLENSII